MPLLKDIKNQLSDLGYQVNYKCLDDNHIVEVIGLRYSARIWIEYTGMDNVSSIHISVYSSNFITSYQDAKIDTKWMISTSGVAQGHRFLNALLDVAKEIMQHYQQNTDRI